MPRIHDFRRLAEWVTRLRSQYSGTNASVLSVEPVLAIPSAALAAIRPSDLFTDAQAAAEFEFSERCRGPGIVGVQGGAPVFHHLLVPPPAVDEAEMTRMGWSRTLVGQAQELQRSANAMRTRLLGVAGRLLTEPTFLRETAGLRQAYEGLSEGVRPEFPLRRSLPAARDFGQTPVSRSVGEFVGRLHSHLDRWGLVGLADWGLPEPQGPLLPSPLTPGSPAEPAHGVRVIVPLHYPLLGDDELLRHVRRAQELAAADLGLPPAAVPVRHHQQFAQIFRLLHLDGVLRSRFPQRPPRGAVRLIEFAATVVLGISVEHARRLRKQISRLRSGAITSIPGRDR